METPNLKELEESIKSNYEKETKTENMKQELSSLRRKVWLVALAAAGYGAWYYHTNKNFEVIASTIAAPIPKEIPAVIASASPAVIQSAIPSATPTAEPSAAQTSKPVFEAVPAPSPIPTVELSAVEVPKVAFEKPKDTSINFRYFVYHGGPMVTINCTDYLESEKNTPRPSDECGILMYDFLKNACSRLGKER